MQQYKRLLAVALFLGTLLAVFELSGLRDHFSLTFLQQQIAENRVSGLLVFVLLGRIWGGLATYVAASISCPLTFFTIRLVGGDALRQLKSKTAVRILGQLDARPIRSVVLLRVLFQTVPALNYALALSGIRFRQYFTGTLLGLPLPIILYCLFFDYLAKMLRIPGVQ